MTDDRRLAALRRHWQDEIPFHVLCGLEVTRFAPDGVTLETAYEERLGNSLGSMHGGVLGTLVDAAAGAAAAASPSYRPGDTITTVDMVVQYLGPVTDRLIVDAECTKRGRQLTFAEVRATNGSGEPVGRGLVTLRVAYSG